jgi:hypothetical protein
MLFNYHDFVRRLVAETLRSISFAEKGDPMLVQLRVM